LIKQSGLLKECPLWQVPVQQSKPAE